MRFAWARCFFFRTIRALSPALNLAPKTHLICVGPLLYFEDHSRVFLPESYRVVLERADVLLGKHHAIRRYTPEHKARGPAPGHHATRGVRACVRVRMCMCL